LDNGGSSPFSKKLVFVAYSAPHESAFFQGFGKKDGLFPLQYSEEYYNIQRNIAIFRGILQYSEEYCNIQRNIVIFRGISCF
jgi:hypothetical protein